MDNPFDHQYLPLETGGTPLLAVIETKLLVPPGPDRRPSDFMGRPLNMDGDCVGACKDSDRLLSMGLRLREVEPPGVILA